MQPASVVEPFQVLEDGAPCYLPIGKAAPMDEFGLEGGNEALCHGVIQSSSGPPIEGTILASWRRLPNESAVYCEPRSLWWIRPAPGLRLHTAISRASTTSSVLM